MRSPSLRKNLVKSHALGGEARLLLAGFFDVIDQCVGRIKTAGRDFIIVRAFSIAARVCALGTFNSSGKAWSLTTRLSKMHTASDMGSPMADRASLACVLISSSMRTCTSLNETYKCLVFRCCVSLLRYGQADVVGMIFHRRR